VTLEIAAAAVAAGARSLVASAGGAMEGRLAAAGAELIRLPMDAKDPLSIALNASRLRRVVRAENVKLVHVRSRAPAFSALWAAKAANVPLVTTYHGLYAGHSPMKRWYNSVMTKGTLVMAGSQFVAAHIAAEHHVAAYRIWAAPEGVDLSVFDPAAVDTARVESIRREWNLDPQDRRQVLLLAARMTRLKGHRLAIEALAALKRRDVVLILAGRPGRPAYESELRDIARRAGLAEQVRFVGSVADMPAAYLAADLVMAPSLVPESFGRTVAEAGAMERPVLAANLGGPAEIVEHGLTGWLVAPADRSAWARALELALATHSGPLAAMGAAARERVARFYSLDRMCRATFRGYLEAIELRNK